MAVERTVPTKCTNACYLWLYVHIKRGGVGVITNYIVHLESALLVNGMTISIVVGDDVGGKLDARTIIIHSNPGIGEIDDDRIREGRAIFLKYFNGNRGV